MDQAIPNFGHNEPPTLFSDPAPDRASDVLALFEDFLETASHQAMDPGARYPSLPHRSSEEDYDMSRVESSSSTQHDEHLFPMSLPESGHSILTQDQDDGLSSSDISTPSE